MAKKKVLQQRPRKKSSVPGRSGAWKSLFERFLHSQAGSGRKRSYSIDFRSSNQSNADPIVNGQCSLPPPIGFQIFRYPNCSDGSDDETKAPDKNPVHLFEHIRYVVLQRNSTRVVDQPCIASYRGGGALK